MKRIWMGAILAGLLLLSGCDYLPFGLTPVKEIVASPAQFEGKEIRVKGKVKDIPSSRWSTSAYTCWMTAAGK